jgi:hypothetical protein
MSETQVLLLADSPAEENEEVIHATAHLLRAANAGQLVAVICTHAETKQPATILCAMNTTDPVHKTAQYIPLAMLFSSGNTPWTKYLPPQCALTVPEPGPLDIFNDDIPQSS